MKRRDFLKSVTGVAAGVPYYDRDKFKPELAEDMNVGDMSVTFKLKKNAKFHDGTQVTAKDVKWSLDRAVSVGGFPTFQMSAGSLTKPEQFVVSLGCGRGESWNMVRRSAYWAIRRMPIQGNC